jgi:putative ABC transport system permease protein
LHFFFSIFQKIKAMQFLRQVWESLRFAFGALRSNLLRTTLSLLSVMVGIVSIIAVWTAVDSMNASVRSQLEGFGKNVLYVTKFPWLFSNNYPWWKYVNRPEMKYREYRFLKDNMEAVQTVAIDDGTGNVTAKYENNSFSLSFLEGFSYEYNQIEDIVILHGRYFLPQEMEGAQPMVLLGYEVAQTLFSDAVEKGVDKTIKLNGKSFRVIGIVAKKGKDALGIGGDLDSKAMIPYQTYAKQFQRDFPQPNICIKALPDDEGQQAAEGEIKGLLRAYRGLRPLDEDNFSVNRLDGALEFFDSISATLNTGGFIIGFFALLIGGFGIANIMFVSVKERTSIIGIQKSLGAKNYVILSQFLFESVLMCLVGGLLGIGVVWGMTNLTFLPFELVLSAKNVTSGLVMASIIGLLFGIIPAWSAARMNPVDAIRSK